MAPFNFKKKKDKDRKHSNSESPTSTSTPSKNVNTTAGFHNYFQQQRQHQTAQQRPQSEPRPQQQFRVYPTPPASQQRNVSGASTALSQPQREYTPWNRVKLQDSPFPRYRHVASSYVSDDNRVYVIGGLHDESVYGDTWIINVDESGTQFTSKTVDISESTPPPRVGHAATLCGNAFVIFGGDTHKVNSEGLMDDDLYLFNINSYKWTIPHPVGPRPLGRYGHKISIIATNQMKTKLYLFGGQFDDTFFNDLAVYDLSSFRRSDSHWEFLKPKTFVPPPLANHTMVSYDHKLWVFGGDTMQGLINKVFVYNITSNDWSLVETTGAKPPPLQEHAALIYKDLMCVIGGKNEQDIYSNSVYFLNLRSCKWFKFPVFKAGIPQSRSGHSITLLKNDKILIMGGDKFDYARQGEHDLSTSDTDMGRGTILYTLDLSRLAELCPGVFDVSEPFNPTTPPINDTTFSAVKNSQPQPNILTPYKNVSSQTPQLNTVTAHNNSANQTPQPNTLTPYSNGAIQTPQVNRTPQQHHLETPQSKVIKHQEEEDEDEEEVDDDGENSSSRRNEELQIPPRNIKRDIRSIKKPVSPVPQLGTTEAAPGPRIASLSSEHKDDQVSIEDEVGVATVASSPLKGDVRYDSNVQQQTQTAEKISQPSDLREPVSITKLEESRRSVALEQMVPDAKSLDSPKMSTSRETVDRDILSHLRSELEQLKLATEKKATEASTYIKQLEAELEKATTGTSKDARCVEFVSLQSRYDVLEADHNTLKDRVQEMEELINSKFMDLASLNKVIKEQNDKIDEYEKQPSYRSELESLKEEYATQSKENEELKSKVKEFESEFRQNLKTYSSQIDKMLLQWAPHASGRGPEGQGAEKATNIVGNSLHHQAVIDKLQKRLDELLQSSNALQKSREELSASYQDLKLKHSTLSQELLTKKSELEKYEDDYGDILSSATNASKALEMSQQEVQKYKQANKKLKAELDELTYAHESSVGEASNASEARIASGSSGASGQDSSMKFARYNAKINDLKAELYIIKQERDNLKSEVLDLKKKQLKLEDD